MKNAKVIKFVVKGALGIVFSAAIGYTIKLEKKIEERIDDHYDEPKAETDQAN